MVNRFAYLTADRAIYDCTTDCVPGLGSKATVLESLRMAIAFSGRWYGFLRGDPQTRWNAHKIAIDAGVLDPDEVRQVEGWNPRAVQEARA